ncbi:putative wiskott-Aldrich syndrome protein family member 2 [Iris pallida]|uniref:Wiskott-Aldrich syndrome protein family member 2 n=1 Tax=Iris pallida TaxID=29817 RepID=A0AAX6E488_IRIPA|nr:putative wiskott-Aldrich syndrome protein family member 2 [Iris pallida]
MASTTGHPDFSFSSSRNPQNFLLKNPLLFPLPTLHSPHTTLKLTFPNPQTLARVPGADPDRRPRGRLPERLAEPGDQPRSTGDSVFGRPEAFRPDP